MKTSQRKHLNGQIYAEASDWLVECRSGDIDAAGRKEFYAWLRASPEHMRAYLELAAIWNEGAKLDPNRTFDDLALLEAARSAGNVIALEGRDDRPLSADAEKSKRVVRSRWVRWSVAASFLAAAIGVCVWAYSQKDVYSTGLGEQRTLALSDGSRIALNAQSKIRIRFSSEQRSIELVAGQAFFEAAKDKNRPLVVASGATRIRVVGTQFDVYRKGSATTVTVIEGRVAIDRMQGANEQPARNHANGVNAGSGDLPVSLSLEAGEQAIVTSQNTIKKIQPNISAATAWKHGQLIFAGASLDEVAEEFNRYNRKHLVIGDSQLARFKVTGNFSSTDASSLIRFLEARPGIAVSDAGDEILVSRKP